MQGTMATEEAREKTKAAEAVMNCAYLHPLRLSDMPLDPGTPVVADEIGNLFSKEALLTVIVEKRLPAEYSHIRGLRDIIPCIFFKNKSASDTASSNADAWSMDTWSPYSCPIANVEMNGRYPFVVLRKKKKSSISSSSSSAEEKPCVNVISEKALKQVGIAALQDEYGPFDEEDVIKLVPSEEERECLVHKMQSRRDREMARKAEKKKTKKLTKRTVAEVSSSSGGDGAASATGGSSSAKKGKPDILANRKASKTSNVGDANAKRILASVMEEAQRKLAAQTRLTDLTPGCSMVQVAKNLQCSASVYHTSWCGNLVEVVWDLYVSWHSAYFRWFFWVACTDYRRTSKVNGLQHITSDKPIIQESISYQELSSCCLALSDWRCPLQLPDPGRRVASWLGLSAHILSLRSFWPVF